MPPVTDPFLPLFEAVLAVEDEADVDRVLQLVVDQARELLDAELGALGVPNAEGSALERFYYAGIDEVAARRIGAPPTGRGLLGIMLQEGQAVRVANVGRHPRSVGVPTEHPAITALLGVPILGDGDTVLGDLYVANPRLREGFAPADQAQLELVARHASIAVRHARLLRRVVASERRYRLLTEGAPDLVFALDGASRLVFANDMAVEVLGADVRALTGLPFRDLFAPQDRAAVDASLAAIAGGRPQATFHAATAPRNAGTPRHLDVSVVPGGVPGIGAQGIARDVTAQREMARQFAERTQELLLTRDDRERLRHFVSAVIQAQEEERARIAGDLHDTTVQTLTAIGRRLRALGERAEAGEIADELGDLAVAALDEADELRRLSRNLRPSVLDHLGLDAALSHLVAQVERDGIGVEFRVIGDAHNLDDRQRTALFRIAQEALTNVRRHSDASAIEVELRAADGWVWLSVADNGTGFDPVAVERDRERRERLGLAGMRERAGMLGGTLTITSQPGGGTTVLAKLPIDA